MILYTYICCLHIHMYVYCMYFICMLYVFYMNICYMFSLCMLLICMYEYVVFMNPVCPIACLPLINCHGNIFIISNNVPSSRQYSFRPNNYTAIRIQRTCHISRNYSSCSGTPCWIWYDVKLFACEQQFVILLFAKHCNSLIS